VALDLGELSIALELENNQFRAGMAEAKAEMSGLGATAEREVGKVSREFDKGGQAAGGKLAQGINAGLIRNSPLIVAGISAALAAGAPVLIAGATTLFAGVGIAAAAQAPAVQSAWVGLWDNIKSSAIDDAQALQAPLISAADRIGAAFTGLRPQLQQAFEGSAPAIASVTDGIIALSENAMPGLLDAVQSSDPVMRGLASLLGSTGTGLSNFFSIISEHSPAAGQAFAALGDILGSALPVLGELLGQGAELAAVVLPPLATAMAAVADAAEDLGPLLPVIAMGLGALKVGNGVTAMFGSLSTRLAANAAAGGALSGVTGSLAGNMGKVASIAGPLGMSIAAVALAYQHGKQQAKEFGQAILDGGQASQDALSQAAANDVTGKLLQGFPLLSAAVGLFTSNTHEARTASRELFAGMNDGEQAAQIVKLRTSELADAVSTYGQSSPQAASAAEALTAAQRAQEDAASALEMAQRGVTAAMVEQANQAMAAIDSSFAYQDSLNQLEDAQAALADAQAHVNDSNADTRTSSEDVQRAQLALAEQAYATAEAYGRQQADLSGLATDTDEYGRLIQTNTLQELYRLRDAAGPEMAGALQQQINMLEASGVSLGETGVAANATRDRIRDLGMAVTEVPGYKGVIIDAPTAEQQARLQALGYTVVTLPNGRVYVTADTADAQRQIAAVQALINGLHDRTVTITTRSATVQEPGVQGMGRAAVGGKAGVRARGFSGGGELSGPGTPTSDSISAQTFSGLPLALSDDEWVIKARSAAKYGDAAMAAVNAGTAQILLPGGATNGRATAPIHVTSGPVHIYLDGQEWRGMARVEAQSVAIDALYGGTDRGRYNP